MFVAAHIVRAGCIQGGLVENIRLFERSSETVVSSDHFVDVGKSIFNPADI